MTQAIERDPIYWCRRFQTETIELCVRWYITYRLSYRDLVAMMAERGVVVSHTTIMRWVLRYVPEFERRWTRYARRVNSSWRVDETAVSVRGGRHYLYRARLAPLIQQEITIRLLTGPHGPQLRHLVTAGSPRQQIAKAVAWLKQNFVQTLHGDELADRAHMSPSTFRQHFRALTGVSPLQYQKQLRLQEARQLMMNQNLDAGSAGGIVGYESASQFSREYSRLFGAPPQRDVRRMRLSQ